MVADRVRRQRARGHARRGEGGGRRAARVHRAAPVLPQPREPPPRGHVPDHAAGARRGVAVRDGERRPVDGGRGRREAARAPRVRRLPAPPAGSGAAREGRRQSVHREGVPDRGERRQAHRDQLQPGAAGRAVHAAAARAAEERAQVDVELEDARPDGKLVPQTLHERNWQPDRDFVSNGATAARRGRWRASSSRRR